MVMIKVLTHRGFAVLALCSLGRYFASLLPTNLQFQSSGCKQFVALHN